MFAPIALENIAFPQSSSLSTLDFIPESFEAFQAYSNLPTSSLFTTQSIVTSFTTSGMRCGMGPNDRILCVPETPTGTAFLWDAQNETSQSVAITSIGSVRNTLWDNVTNSWIVCGTTHFAKMDCNTLVQTNIAVPTGQTGTQYAAVVAYGGKAYGLPLVTAGASTKVAIFDLVNNTSTLSANTVGTAGGFWGAVLTSVGTIYFVREATATNSIYEYNPITDTGTNFSNLSGNVGYGAVNLPNGNVFIAPYSTSQTYQNLNVYIINPVNKAVQTIGSAGFGYGGGICVGQSGIVYGIRSEATGTSHGLYGFNPITNTGFKTDYPVQRCTSGARGFMDFFSLSDGRLIAMPGVNNNGLLCYYNYLNNPRTNTFQSIGGCNPIIANSKGL